MRPGSALGLELDREIEVTAREDPVAKRLQQLHGIGPLVATALVATVGDAKQFRNGRQMAASIGLTPRQDSSGSKERLLGITKRGDTYLPTLMIHGARSALRTAKNKEDRLSRWVSRLAETRHHNVAAVALANKMDGPRCLGDDEERHRISTVPNLAYEPVPRLHSRPLDGSQVEPAPAEPENVQGHQGRKSDWGLVRE